MNGSGRQDANRQLSYHSGPSTTFVPSTSGQATPMSSSPGIPTPNSSNGNNGGYAGAYTYEVSPPNSPAIGAPHAGLSGWQGNSSTDVYNSGSMARPHRIFTDRISPENPRPISQLSFLEGQGDTQNSATPTSSRASHRFSLPPTLVPAAPPAYQIPAAPPPPSIPSSTAYDHGTVSAEAGPSSSRPTRNPSTGGHLASRVFGSFRSPYRRLSSGQSGVALEEYPEGDVAEARLLSHQKKRDNYGRIREADSDDESVSYDISSFGGGPLLQRTLSASGLKHETERNRLQLQGEHAAEFHQLERLEALGITNGLGGGMVDKKVNNITALPDGSIAQGTVASRTIEPSTDLNRLRSPTGLTRGGSIRDIAQREAKQTQQIVVVNEYPGVDLTFFGGGNDQTFRSSQGDVEEVRGLDSEATQSFFFPPDPDMPDWKPLSMRWPYLSFLIFLALCMAAIQEFLYQISDRRSREDPPRGLLTFKSPKQLNVGQYFAWKYMPTLVTVLYGIMWQVVDFEVKRLEPYYQLSQKTGALAEESLNIDYLTFWHYLTPFKAIRYRHWAVAYCSVATLLAASLAPPLLTTAILLTPGQKERLPDKPKYVHIHHIWSRFISTTFVLVAILGVLLIVQLRRKSGLLSDPKGIAGIAAMATKSHILMDFQGLDIEKEEEIHKRLRHRRYVLHKSSLWQGEYVRNKDQRPEQRTVQDPHPLMLRPKAGIPYIISIFIFMGIIPVLVFNPTANIITEKAPWLLTAGAVLIKLMWGTMECDIRMMEPFYVLSKRRAPSRILTIDYTGTIPGVMPIVALMNKHYLVAVVGFNAVLAEVLTVCVSSFGVKGSDFLGIDTDQRREGEETFTSFWVSFILTLGILLSLAISASFVYYYRGKAFLPRQPGTIASVLAFIHQSKMLWDFVDTEKMNAKEMAIHLEKKNKTYGFGWFSGRDRQRHCGVDEEELTDSYKVGVDLKDASNPWDFRDQF